MITVFRKFGIIQIAYLVTIAIKKTCLAVQVKSTEGTFAIVQFKSMYLYAV